MTTPVPITLHGAGVEPRVVGCLQAFLTVTQLVSQLAAHPTQKLAAAMVPVKLTDHGSRGDGMTQQGWRQRSWHAGLDLSVTTALRNRSKHA